MRKSRKVRKVRKVRKARRDIKSRKKKRKKNRKSRKRIRKGGFFSSGINEKMFEEWKRKSPLKEDCCPCVFSFLGLPDNAVLELKVKFENWVKGMTGEEIQNVFKSNYSGYDFKFERSPILSGINREKSLDDIIHSLKKTIPIGSATVGGVQWCGGSDNSRTCPTSAADWAPRHCFLIGNDQKYGLYFADVQQGKVYTGKKEIMKWLMEPPDTNGVAIPGMQTEFLWILTSGLIDSTTLKPDWSNPLRVVHPVAQDAARAAARAAARDAARDAALGVADMEID
jgi:hypothetical protein